MAAPPRTVTGGVGLADSANPVFQSVTLSQTGYLYESYADSLTAFAGGGQTNATQLAAEINRVTTVATAGDSVKLPASVPGLTVVLVNGATRSMQVYGAGTDTINGVATATGVAHMPGSVVLYVCITAGAWFTEGLATGFSGSLQTLSFVDGITAAGTNQATATPLTGMINNVATVASGTGVNLPSSAAGLNITVINSGANALEVYPAQGSSDTINTFAASNGVTILPSSVATFECTAAGAWWASVATTKMAGFNTNTATAGTTLTAANISGAAASVDLALTGTLSGGANAQLPTVASLVAIMHSPAVGSSYRLRIINQSAGAFSWTVTTNTGWTLTGTMTIAQNTWREFVVTLTSTSAATLQSVATGTFS